MIICDSKSVYFTKLNNFKAIMIGVIIHILFNFRKLCTKHLLNAIYFYVFCLISCLGLSEYCRIMCETKSTISRSIRECDSMIVITFIGMLLTKEWKFQHKEGKQQLLSKHIKLGEHSKRSAMPDKINV